MSKYEVKPFDTGRIRTYPLKDRPSKVGVASFGRPHTKGGTVSEFLEGLPAILAAQGLRDLAHAISGARGLARPVLWGFGAHVIKTGLSPVVIDLMDRGLVSGIALNGAGVIHDFEIAAAGFTSEDVQSRLEHGDFGMAEETGRQINEAVRAGTADALGVGEALGRHLASSAPEFARYSLLAQAYLRNIPVTVHVTIGADTIHNHPAFSAADMGEASYRDFRVFASLVARLNDGGVYVNCGSAVTLPEVFLKCVTLVRNTGTPLDGFTTANLDFIQHYRPTENIVRRPVQKNGRGIAITGHHELVLPLLAAWLVELSPGTRTDA
jgi:hypothetical protein